LHKTPAEDDRNRLLAAGLGMGAETASKASTSTGSASHCSMPASSSSSSSDQEALYIFTIIRSELWGAENGPEDVWQVEVPRSASALELKQQILELYGVPVEAQRLQCTPSPEDECLDDQAVVAHVLGTSARVQSADVPLHLLPSASWLDGVSSSLRRQQDASQAAADADEQRAFIESLRGVSYRLQIVRPEAAGGRAAGKRVELKLEALMLAGNAKAIAEAQLLGRASGREPAYLMFAGQVLPPEISLHFAGVADGDTLLLAANPGLDILHKIDSESEADSDADSLEAGMQRWAGKY